MPLSLEQRNPGLVDKVNKAYEQAEAQNGTVRNLGGAVLLGDALQTAKQQAREQGILGGLEDITDPETRQAFEQTFTNTEKLFNRIGLTPPTAEELTNSGIDLSHLADVYETMQKDKLEPRIVLSPTTLSIDQASDLFNDLTNDKTIPNNPLQHREDGNGLAIHPGIAKHWSELTSPDLLPNDLPIHTSADGTSWSIRIIPGTPEPTHTNVAHNDPTYPDKPTITEYLTTQANLIQAGEQPIDTNSWTWLQGTFDNGSFAPFGRWVSGGGQVDLFWGETDGRGDRLGVRSPH